MQSQHEVEVGSQAAALGGLGGISGNFSLDQAIVDKIPSNLRIVSVISYGSSAWSDTGRISCVRSDGSTKSFFIKCVEGESGRPQLEGEFVAMSELYKTKPELVPQPMGWGTRTDGTAFFFCKYRDFADRLPDPVKLGAAIADLHKSSTSPTGKFGFHLPTFDGKYPQVTEWDSSWMSFFSKLLAGLLQLDTQINGSWKELTEAADQVIVKVIPRLLGALEADGRTIKPCLIHGDLWEGNIGTDTETGNIFLVDSSAFYAHNEMEMGMWRCEHHSMKAKPYRREYLRHFEPSEPVDEWDDRNRLYSTKTTLMNSAHFPGSHTRRQTLQDFEFLIEKYGSS